MKKTTEIFVFVFYLRRKHSKSILNTIKYSSTLQRQFRLYIPFLGIAQPQP
jgi:hypothetical protein